MKSLSSSMLLQVLTSFEELRIDVDALLSSNGLTRAALGDEGAWTPAATVDALWHSASAQSGQEDFALRVAKIFQPKHLGALGYLLASSTNVMEAIERLMRFSALTGDASEVKLELDEEGARYIHSIPAPPLSRNRHHAEWSLAIVVLLLRELTGEPGWSPKEVCFTHARPEQTNLHIEIFGHEPSFSSAVDCLHFERDFLTKPFLGAETVLSKILENHAATLLERLPKTDGFLETVTSALQKELAGGKPTIDRIARSLGFSTRSLQRRLDEHESSFQRILEAIREQMATTYLADRSMTLSEAAYLLGYGEASSFTRAFKRWHGLSPSEWRARRTEELDR